MKTEKEQLQSELEDLKQDLQNFQLEKERVREILGTIGGVPKFHTRIVNIIFLVTIAVSLVIAAFVNEEWQLFMIEITTVALSLKIIYLIHCQMRVNHFQFWVLSSLEWRINELMKITRETSKQVKSEPQGAVKLEPQGPDHEAAGTKTEYRKTNKEVSYGVNRTGYIQASPQNQL